MGSLVIESWAGQGGLTCFVQPSRIRGKEAVAHFGKGFVKGVNKVGPHSCIFSLDIGMDGNHLWIARFYSNFSISFLFFPFRFGSAFLTELQNPLL